MDPGQNPEWRYACLEALKGVQAEVKRFDSHRAWMTAHPVSCLEDAYADDYALMDYLQHVALVGILAAGTSEAELRARFDAFSQALPTYVDDCS
jgi:hypothetical protein